MPRYLNTSGATLTFQGIVFKPGDVHDVPNPIHSRIMYPTNLPCTKPSNDLDILNSEVEVSQDIKESTAENTSDINETIESNKPKTKSKTNIKEEKDGTNNNK